MSDTTEPTSYQLAILAGLQRKPVFGGLTDEQWARVDRRRAKRRMRRATRQSQRRAAA